MRLAGNIGNKHQLIRLDKSNRISLGEIGTLELSNLCLPIVLILFSFYFSILFIYSIIQIFSQI